MHFLVLFMSRSFGTARHNNYVIYHSPEDENHGWTETGGNPSSETEIRFRLSIAVGTRIGMCGRVLPEYLMGCVLVVLLASVLLASLFGASGILDEHMQPSRQY